MSTANLVPETWGLTGDDARETLERTGRWKLVRDAFLRLRFADGFSHARSMAFATTLLFLEGVIALLGLASALDAGGSSDFIVSMLHQVVPGPAGAVLTDAVRQAHEAGASQRYGALILGLAGALVTGATLMGQIERALNRMYGVEQDRPTIEKYGRALLLTITAGILFIVAFAAIGLGRAVTSSLHDHTASTVWSVARWPLAIGVLISAIALLFRWSPRRRQPEWSWLAFGALISVLAFALVSFGLDAVFRISSTFGSTYGPLAGVVALLLWAFLASVAVLLGGAIGAQLEAVRAGRPEPQSAKKVAESEPDAAPLDSDPRV